MSGLGQAFSALKNVALLHERVAGLRTDVAGLNTDMTSLRDYIVTVDKRVARVEGFIEGAAAASGQGQRMLKDDR